MRSQGAEWRSRADRHAGYGEWGCVGTRPAVVATGLGGASCSATSIAMRAAKQGVHLTTLEVTVESYSDRRGMLGLDDTVSAGLSSITVRVKIGAEGLPAERLHELVQWGECHSPIACTVRDASSYAFEVEIV